MPLIYPPTVVSHWAKLIEDFQTSPLELYAAIEEAVKRRKIPNVEISRVDWNEGGVFSVKREYLRIARGRVFYDVCGAPFGTGFFVSSWLIQPGSPLWPIALFGLFAFPVVLYSIFVAIFGFIFGTFLAIIGTPVIFWALVNALHQQREGWDDAIVAIPIIGPIYEKIFRPATYYKIDTASMFQQAVQSAVMEAVDQVTTAKGVRGLTELDKKPTMTTF